MIQRVAHALVPRLTDNPSGRGELAHAISLVMEPLVLLASLWYSAFVVTGRISPHTVFLSLVVFSLTFPATPKLALPMRSVITRIVFGWMFLSGALFAIAYWCDFLGYFNPRVIILWWWIAPPAMIAGHVALRLAAPRMIKAPVARGRAVVAGINAQSVELARRLESDPFSGVTVVGFFDDRARERLGAVQKHPLLGPVRDLPAFARDAHVDLIYVSLPMTPQPRIVSLLEELSDTTASVYFLPDPFVSTLIGGRLDRVEALPVVPACESPFRGVNGVVKRVSDTVIASILSVLLAPLMLLIALAVRLDSPGPVIFRQRRHGLNGEEIVVYKFRSMTVCEDGDDVAQARRSDPRVTRVGGFLRRTSLDELPQLFNVLQGAMSLVGPRPHCVAHNEFYGRVVRGYLRRHKIKPGITGWAQVNGLRGETDTVDKMRARIERDLEYLRNWSLRLDLFILLKTVWVVLAQRNNAY
jgi:putative colanic acid biosynthesis UDP-glucose lipid carrier transferase